MAFSAHRRRTPAVSILQSVVPKVTASDAHFSRVLAAFLACLCTLPCSFGCRRKPAENSDASSPFAGEEIRISLPDGLGLSEHWKFPLDEWSAQTAGRCVLAEYDPSSLSEATSSDLDRTGATPWPEADLIVFPITRIGELARSKALAPFSRDQLSDAALNWRDLFKGLRDTVGSPGRSPTVLPICCPVLVCYYRRDLLEAAGRSEPETWDDYLRLVKTVSEWAPGLTAVEPWGKSFRATTFLARAVSYARPPSQYSVFFDIQTGAPLIDSAPFARALERAREAVAAMPAAVTSYSPVDCRRDILEGKAAIALTYETGSTGSRTPFAPTDESHSMAEDDDIAGHQQHRADGIHIGFCRLPGSSEFYDRETSSWKAPRDAGVNRVDLVAFGGLCAATSAKSSPAKRQASANLLSWVAVRELQTCFPGPTKSPCRESHLNNPFEWTGTDLFPDEGLQYLQAVASALRDPLLVAELPVVGRSQYRAALTEGIGQVLSGAAGPQESLANVAKNWEMISRHLGVEIVRNSYRASLGLPPISSTPALSRPLSP